MLEQLDIHDALEEVRGQIPRIDRTARPEEVYDAVHRLILGVFKLGLELEKNVGRLDDEVRAQIKADGDALAEVLPAISYYVVCWQDRFYGEWEQRWLNVSVVRSGLEFLRTIYADTALGARLNEQVPDLLDDLDDLMRERAVHDGGIREEDIPEGVPASHWWWRAPDG